jgi:hypothetical protein
MPGGNWMRKICLGEDLSFLNGLMNNIALRSLNKYLKKTYRKPRW